MPIVEVRAGCRLHFGLYSFGRSRQESSIPSPDQHPLNVSPADDDDDDGNDFGGVGVILQEPGIDLQIEPASAIEYKGRHTQRMLALTELWHAHHAIAPRPLKLDLRSAPPHHQGLGLGTALGMSIAAGLRAFYGMPPGSVAELARSVGRGRRSAIGAHGFLLGGLIAEEGKSDEQELSGLEARIVLPEDWRFVLAVPCAAPGLSGHEEATAFHNAPAVDATTRAAMRSLSHELLLPAARAGDFEAFSEAVYRYGYAAGDCFASVQGGPYNGAEVQALVESIRRAGVRGVGQSSWGPAVYAICKCKSEAEQLVQTLKSGNDLEDIRVVASRPNGASIKILG